METEGVWARAGRKKENWNVVVGPCPVPGSVLRFKKRFGVFCLFCVFLLKVDITAALCDVLLSPFIGG